MSGTGEVVPEAVVAHLRSHGRALILPSLALIAVVGATAYFGGSFAIGWLDLAVILAGAALAILLFVVPWIAWWSRSYTITTRRVVLRSGLLVRTRQELLHTRGYDVRLRQDALQRLFGSGDLLLDSGSDRTVVLRDVPGAPLVHAALHELIERSLNPAAAWRSGSRTPPPDR